MRKIVDDAEDLLKLSDDELHEHLLDPTYENKANLRELVRRSLALAKRYKENAEQFKMLIEREKVNQRLKKRRKTIPCTACAGSGFYDSDDNPPCGACNGTGVEE